MNKVIINYKEFLILLVLLFTVISTVSGKPKDELDSQIFLSDENGRALSVNLTTSFNLNPGDFLRESSSLINFSIDKFSSEYSPLENSQDSLVTKIKVNLVAEKSNRFEPEKRISAVDLAPYNSDPGNTTFIDSTIKNSISSNIIPSAERILSRNLQVCLSKKYAIMFGIWICVVDPVTQCTSNPKWEFVEIDCEKSYCLCKDRTKVYNVIDLGLCASNRCPGYYILQDEKCDFCSPTPNINNAAFIRDDYLTSICVTNCPKDLGLAIFSGKKGCGCKSDEVQVKEDTCDTSCPPFMIENTTDSGAKVCSYCPENKYFEHVTQTCVDHFILYNNIII